jgi:ABC-type glycerol-3-phosphate transport system substrate-binding protein
VAALSYQGDVYALPYDWAIRGLYVNREIMDPIVPYPVADDYTYEDLMEYAIAATGEDEQGNKLFGLQLGTDATFMWYIIKSMGVNFWGEDYREAYFTDPTVVDMMQYMWDLRWKHGAFPTPEDEQLMGVTGEFSFISGRVAMRAGLNDVAFRYDEGIGDNFLWGVWPMPMGETGRVAYIGNSGWFLPTGTRYPDLGYEMIRFCLSNPEVLPTTGVMGSMFVGRKSFIEWGLPTGDLAAQIPNYEHVFVDLAREAEENVPWFPGMQEFEAIYTKWMDPIFLEGEPNVEEALANLNEETNEFLAAGDW